MSGSSNYGQQFMTCPACGSVAQCDAVDVGVGLYVSGQYICDCGWEIDGPDDFGFVGMEDRPFANIEFAAS